MQTLASKWAYARAHNMVVVFDNCWRFEAVGPDNAVTVDRRPGIDGGFLALLRDNKSRAVVGSGFGDTITEALQALLPI